MQVGAINDDQTCFVSKSTGEFKSSNNEFVSFIRIRSATNTKKYDIDPLYKSQSSGGHEVRALASPSEVSWISQDWFEILENFPGKWKPAREQRSIRFPQLKTLFPKKGGGGSNPTEN